MTPFEFQNVWCISNSFAMFILTHSATIISHDSSNTKTGPFKSKLLFSCQIAVLTNLPYQISLPLVPNNFLSGYFSPKLNLDSFQLM